jgi:hypothetical protein
MPLISLQRSPHLHVQSLLAVRWYGNSGHFFKNGLFPMRRCFE